MRTRMSGSWSLWVAAACLAAFTSTASAQSGEWKDGTVPAGPISGSQVSMQPGSSLGGLSAHGVADATPTITGTCGTDTTVKPLDLDRARLAAVLFHMSTALFPAHPLMRLAAFRLWLQSTIDVLPPL